MSDTDVTQTTTSTNRTRDCKVVQYRFSYGPANQVGLRRPCLEPGCRTCQKHHAHLLPALDLPEPETAPANTGAPQHRQAQREPAYEEDRVRPRMRRRVVLHFTKPGTDAAVEKTPWGMYAMFIYGNKIPLVTGKSGGLVKPCFVEKKAAFAEMVETWCEQPEWRMPIGDLPIGKSSDEDETGEEKVDEEPEVGEEGSDVVELDPIVDAKRKAEDDWWDADEDGLGGKRRRTMMQL